MLHRIRGHTSKQDQFIVIRGAVKHGLMKLMNFARPAAKTS